MEKDMTIDAIGADERIYEVGFLIIPTVNEDGLVARVAAIREAINSINGTVIAEGAAKKIDLAYPMTKVAQNKRATYSSAYSGWFKFEAEPKGAKEIATVLKADEDVLRFLLIKTVREDTMAPRKLFEKKKEGKDADEAEVAPVATEAEIDASIDKLIAE
ncbi:MAG TPA: 30S ribosomal protein S6 [Candidatus Paceibacterota bacterium]|nr:30S ribosomal protein S6 [Candidatus Paceibacterota bacterium]